MWGEALWGESLWGQAMGAVKAVPAGSPLTLMLTALGILVAVGLWRRSTTDNPRARKDS